ncbi:hypothetical protein [Bacillus sp. FDAARGOS_1420]|nr:hypothetical protein [Bacillus sp. FDAARGOS_1420]MBW3496111.1 hypothetical protein [Bacillus sp. FDAARGOS_1420]
MAVLKDTTYIETNTYNEIKFFKGIIWRFIFVVPFWSMIITLLLWYF